MLIFVELRNGKTIPIEVLFSDTIASIKEKVLEMEGFVSNNHLINFVDLLSENEPLSDYYICGKSTMYLFDRSKEGEQDFKMCIKTLHELDSRKVSLIMEVKSFDNIRDVMIKIWNMFRIPISQQKLILDKGRLFAHKTPSSTETVIIYVKMYSGNFVELMALSSDTIWQVKVKLQYFQNIPAKQQSLTLGSVKLEDMHTLAYYKIDSYTLLESQLMTNGVLVFVKTMYGNIDAIVYDPFDLIEKRDNVQYLTMFHSGMLDPSLTKIHLSLQVDGAMPIFIKALPGERLSLAIDYFFE